jgi:hypothetical protein
MCSTGGAPSSHNCHAQQCNCSENKSILNRRPAACGVAPAAQHEMAPVNMPHDWHDWLGKKHTLYSSLQSAVSNHQNSSSKERLCSSRCGAASPPSKAKGACTQRRCALSRRTTQRTTHIAITAVGALSCGSNHCPGPGKQCSLQSTAGGWQRWWPCPQSSSFGCCSGAREYCTRKSTHSWATLPTQLYWHKVLQQHFSANTCN